MRSIDIKLVNVIPGGTPRVSYKHNAITVDILKVLDKPHGYMYFNYKTRTTGTFTINKILDRFGQQLELGAFLPMKDVVNFFVYYAYSFDYPLMMCIATMKRKGFITYLYFTPSHKNSKTWNEVRDLVSDPKWSSSMNSIKYKLDQSFALMGGVEIHIDKTQNYTKQNIVIKPYPVIIESYRIYTHEVETRSEFILNRLRNNDEIITDIEFNRPVVAIYVIGRKNIDNYKPIIICVVESPKRNQDPNIYHWYSLEHLNSTKWVKRHSHSDLFTSTNFEYELDLLIGKYHEFDIFIDNNFFHDQGLKEFSNNGQLFNQIYKQNIGSDFTKHTCELVNPLAFKVNTIKIYDIKQTGLPKDMHHKFHVFCNERYDPYLPMIICVQFKDSQYRWYALEHFASNNWVEHSNLENVNPDNFDYLDKLDKIYQDLFWINLDISYEKLKDVKQYNRSNRYIGTKEFKRKGFRKVEVINFSSYPFHVKILLDGKKQSGINEMREVHNVYIFYYEEDTKILPMFICFDMANYYREFRWFSRLREDSNDWLTNTELKDSDPKEFTFQILKNVHEGVYNYQLQEKQDKEEEPSSMQGVTAKAIGSSFGAAAFCGVGYLAYNNFGTIMNFFR